YAVAFGLVVCSALLIKNFVLLRSRDTGLRTERIVAFRTEASGPRYEKDSQVRNFYHGLYSRLRQMQGVENVGMTSHLPMVDYGYNGEFRVDGESPWPANQSPLVEYRWFYGDYLKTLGVALLQGRMLDDLDGEGTRTVLINKAMAEKFWPNQNPIGHH